MAPVANSSVVDTSQRLEALRNAMKQHKLAAYIVPSEDAHQSEYIADIDKRRAWISGFTGSAGTAVVTLNQALMWTDGRYFLQASREMDKNWTLMKMGLPEVPTKEDWLSKNLNAGDAVGLDPKLISVGAAKELNKSIEASGKDIKVVALPENLIDSIWKDQPARPLNKVAFLEDKFTGKCSEDKVQDLRTELGKKNTVAFIVTALDEIAWLFNLRGSDIAFNPVFFAYAVVTLEQVLLYIDESKLTPEVKEQLPSDTVVKPYDAVFEDLTSMTKGWKEANQKIWIDARCNLALKMVLDPEIIEESRSPIMLSKSIKNDVEMEGFRQSHIRDAAAVCDYIAWLEKELLEKKRSDLTEYQGSRVLADFRAKQSDFVGLSFETISSSGPNAAIIHYAPPQEGSAIIKSDQIYLLDSGGQYKDGTTDITRTMHFGAPQEFERECFTRVLQGHIALDTLIFPNGTTGYIIDAMARRPLWEVGLDFRHGTGHGVGAYLNVHEGPQGIGTRISCNDVPLKAGMTVTNEPGFYLDGQFGIRIENVLLVKEVETPNNFGERGYLGFEHVTLVPMQQKLIVKEMLSEREKKWIDAYHAKCWEKVGAIMPESDGKKWLYRETRPMFST